MNINTKVENVNIRDLTQDLRTVQISHGMLSPKRSIPLFSLSLRAQRSGAWQSHQLVNIEDCGIASSFLQPSVRKLRNDNVILFMRNKNWDAPSPK
jgi:hypothetical protein